MSDTTFTGYSEQQGKVYAQSRPDYHQSLYDAVMNQHTSTGGQLDTLVDLGCGPGQAARALAPQFKTAIGLDPSASMISVARSLGGETSTTKPIRFEVSAAEELGANLNPAIADESVDLITAATSAHWFDMDIFWPKAAQVLKPGGSVAIWVNGETRIHSSVPNAATIQTIVTRYRVEDLARFLQAGNDMSQNCYADLPLPWTISNPVAELEESSFFRRHWKSGDDFFKSHVSLNLDGFEDMLSTFSPITRWREAHPDDVGTENDLVKRLLKDIRQLQHEAGVEPGEELISLDTTGVLLVIKKKRFLIISDTHGEGLPTAFRPDFYADVLIHCGDLTGQSKLHEFESTLEMINNIKASLKLVVPGNHDFTLDRLA
ncbi:unnamed protein product [Clonostachys solani]|uniref:Trans-aconitate 3-methyltransferase n=1 Tax=Clonostachys solani TaxID=160281 RepID=A0A9P0EF17_9HYPO|nr:unnamed protein product [Clonostachys solani]